MRQCQGQDQGALYVQLAPAERKLPFKRTYTSLDECQQVQMHFLLGHCFYSRRASSILLAYLIGGDSWTCVVRSTVAEETQSGTLPSRP